MTTCWRCKSPHPLFIYDESYNCLKCFYCGHLQDFAKEMEVKVAQIQHDKLNLNPKSYGSDPDYKTKRKWSMKG